MIGRVAEEIENAMSDDEETKPKVAGQIAALTGIVSHGAAGNHPVATGRMERDVCVGAMMKNDLLPKHAHRS